MPATVSPATRDSMASSARSRLRPVPSLGPLGIGILLCAGLGIEGLRRLRKRVREGA